ncbi:AGAP001432-PA-like protein [Anopheles sinensis]|uniref:AGAP001432-PA-like protein n=1 Tax=Anopheles sinensis TaxID=74873 RepID=A0A084VHA6_ANOSI|nr:AGAP001432-PA-like protein [Anopheles sinensis]
MASNYDHEQEDDNKEHIETIPVLENSLEEDEDPLDEDNSANEEWTMEPSPEKLVPVVVARKRKNTIANIVEMQAKVKRTASPLSSIGKKPITIQMSDGTILRKARLVCAKIGQNQIQIPTGSVEEHNSSMILNLQSPIASVADNQSSVTMSSASRPAAQKSPATSSTKSIELKTDTHTELNSNDEPQPMKQEQISEFIFKGEEYVQMPKALYNKKLEVLKRKVTHYETIIQMMRDVMGQADDYNLFDS